MIRTFDSAEFRHILGHYPTGVCAVTATAGGVPIGMIVGSFTSVSLDPPLVAFFPDRSSATWPRIQASGRFCVNVLADGQHEVCRALASRLENKFAGVAYRASDAGSPIIDGVVAWIDCTLHAVHEAGDHFIALGEVQALGADRGRQPMLFHRGGYGGFAPAI